MCLFIGKQMLQDIQVGDPKVLNSNVGSDDAAVFTGNVTGNVTGDTGNLTGNARYHMLN